MAAPSSEVLASRVIAQQVKQTRSFLAGLNALAERPPDGSFASADLDFINSKPASHKLPGLKWWAHRAVAMNVQAAEEHLLGVERVLSGDALLPVPAMALTRCVYDAIIQACWLVDTRVTTEQRLARWAGRLLHDTQEPPNALASFGGMDGIEDERDQVDEARALAQGLMTRSGFELKAKGGDRSDETARVTYLGEVSSLTPKVEDLTRLYMPKLGYIWTVYSGAVHSRGWFIPGIDGDDRSLSASVLSPVLDVADLLTIELTRYFGLDPSDELRQTHRRRTALMVHTVGHGGAGGFGHYLRQTGRDPDAGWMPKVGS